MNRLKIIEDAANKMQQQAAKLKSVGLINDAIQLENQSRAIFERMANGKLSTPMNAANREQLIIKDMER